MNKKNSEADRLQDEADLRLIRQIKRYADEGYDVELRKAPGGGYKILRVKKELLKAD